MRIKTTPARIIFLVSFLICCLAFAIVMYLELANGLEPCPLCILQRIVVIILGVFFLIAAIHGPKRRGIRVYSFLFFILCFVGVSISVRQVWLQSLPIGEAPMCGPGIGYMFQSMPFKEFLLTIFQGTGQCAVVHWQFLSLSLAGWAVVFFATLGFIHLWHVFRHLPKNSNKQ
ncbi:MAG: disulfide bond formation protein DsbB [Francisellaceae bacterium]|jgi:disulfide bond formation protein DsbB